jgi:putative NIF3 family GTP cyclohydrolase 1 type 2
VGARGRLSEEPELRLEVVVPQGCADGVVAALRAAHPYEEVAFDLLPLEGQDPEISLGLRGVLPRRVPLAAFARAVCDALDLGHARVVGRARAGVRQVAVLGGAGGGEIPKIPSDIDVYVTGDVKYHEADAAQARGLAVIDAGHAGTEKAVAAAMAARLKQSLKGLPVKAHVEPELFALVTRHAR